MVVGKNVTSASERITCASHIPPYRLAETFLVGGRAGRIPRMRRGILRHAPGNSKVGVMLEASFGRGHLAPGVAHRA